MNQLRAVVLGSTVLAIVAAVLSGTVGAPAAPRISLPDDATGCYTTHDPSVRSAFFSVPVSNDTARAVTLKSVAVADRVGFASLGEWIVVDTGSKSIADFTVALRSSQVTGWSSRRSIDGAVLPAHSTSLLVMSGHLLPSATHGYAARFAVTSVGPLGALVTGKTYAGGLALLTTSSEICSAPLT